MHVFARTRRPRCGTLACGRSTTHPPPVRASRRHPASSSPATACSPRGAPTRARLRLVLAHAGAGVDHLHEHVRRGAVAAGAPAGGRARQPAGGRRRNPRRRGRRREPARRRLPRPRAPGRGAARRDPYTCWPPTPRCSRANVVVMCPDIETFAPLIRRPSARGRGHRRRRRRPGCRRGTAHAPAARCGWPAARCARPTRCSASWLPCCWSWPTSA